MRNWQGSKWIRPEKREAIYDRDGYCCCYCGVDLASASSANRTLDHVRPVELGGTNAADNLVTACKCCNSAKQDKRLSAFIAYVVDAAAERGVSIDANAIRNNVRNATRRSLSKKAVALRAAA